MCNIPGVFGIRSVGSLPSPVGFEIEDGKDDIIYLGSSLDKLSMRGDRMRIVNDLSKAIKEAKYEQACKTN